MDFVGIGLHEKTISICVVNQECDILDRKGFFCSAPEHIVAFFESIQPFRVVVEATAPLAAVSLVTNGGAELALPFGDCAADASGTLGPPRAWAYYYVRAVQRDDHVAWSSPIWLDRG